MEPTEPKMDLSENLLEKLLHEVQGMRTDIREFDKRVASLEQDRGRTEKIQGRVFTAICAVLGTALVIVATGLGDYNNVKNRLGIVEAYGSPLARTFESRIQKLESQQK
jgi:hypothetical protein